jgi:hypothetical protein
MSDHAWVQENVAAYLAGGLDAQEAERLEAHARDCPACGAVLADAARLDSELSALFAGAHPGPELEDRAIDRLRTASARTWPVLNRRAKWALAAAAVLILGLLGGLMDQITSDGGFRMPGQLRMEAPGTLAPETAGRQSEAKPNPRGVRDRVVTTTAEIESEDPGLDSRIEAALPDIDRLDKHTVDSAVSQDNLGQPETPTTDTTALKDPKDSKNPGTSGTGTGMGMGQGMGMGYGLPPITPASGTVPPPVFDPVKVKPVFDPTGPSKDSQPKPDEKPEPKPDPKSDPVPNPKPVDPKIPDPNPEPLRRIIIRSGDIEFEIESFDAATATITKLVLGIKGAFVADIKSDKLTNGKVKGFITVRVPPEHLDGLVLDLRRELGKGGELKGIKLSSQDVTKMYTDLESHLRGARTMEQRLLQIIKEGKGEIKQLLEAEKELGVWRTKIEELEGEIRYYSNLAAFSKLTITLTEKEIRAAAAITERERVQAGVEVDDVDKAYQQILAAVVEAKGRITKSELKQLAAGQFNATFNFEVAADAAGPLRDRLQMLGRVARLEIDRAVQTEGGTLPSDVKPKRGDTIFLVQLYNLANVTPRETTALQVAAADVPAAYQALRDAIAKTTGRVTVAQLNEQDRQNITAELDFEVRRAEEGAARAALTAAGEVVSRQVSRAAESDSVTDSKVLYKVTLLSSTRIKPRETATLQVAATDVPAAYQALRDAVARSSGRVLVAQLNEQDRRNITAELVFEVRRTEEGAVRLALDSTADVISRQVTRTTDADGTTDAKVLYKMTLVSTNRLKPRETTTLSVEVTDVDGLAAAFATHVAEAKGRQIDAKLDRDYAGHATAKLIFEVPLAAAPAILERFKTAGTVRAAQSNRDLQATEGKYATARIYVTLTNVEAIVPEGTGLWSKVRKGLSISASVLLTSVTWVVFGLCVVLPWAVLGFGGYRVARRFVRQTPPAPTPPAPAPAPPA